MVHRRPRLCIRQGAAHRSPMLAKDPYYSNGVLRRQWRAARWFLSHADRIVVMGYSMPPSDLASKLLISTAQTGCAVEVVDRNPEAAVAIAARLPAFDVRQRFSGETAIADYVASL